MKDKIKTRRYDITQEQDIVDEAKGKFERQFDEANLSLIIRILLQKYVTGEVPITIYDVIANSKKYRRTYERILAEMDNS